MPNTEATEKLHELEAALTQVESEVEALEEVSRQKHAANSPEAPDALRNLTVALRRAGQLRNEIDKAKKEKAKQEAGEPARRADHSDWWRAQGERDLRRAEESARAVRGMREAHEKHERWQRFQRKMAAQEAEVRAREEERQRAEKMAEWTKLFEEEEEHGGYTAEQRRASA